MALKDLVAQKAKLTEEAIEEIVADYVRYDIEVQEIVFTPEATGLSNKAKVLVFLVAQQGWQFVQGEAVDVEMAPSELEESVGVPGGTLRPILKDLKDRNFLTATAGKYTVRSTSLDAIKAELVGSGGPIPKRRKTTKPRRESRPSGDSVSTVDDAGVPEKARPKRSKNSARTGPKPGEAFNETVAEGFFDDGRTLAQLQDRLHERAILVQRTSLPKYLLAAVRDGRLTRGKQEVDGKRVWVYTRKK